MKMFDADKTRMIGLPYGEKKTITIFLSRFHPIPERHGRTDRQADRQTDRHICYINIARQCADARQKSDILVGMDLAYTAAL